jgi:recombination protein RecT
MQMGEVAKTWDDVIQESSSKFVEIAKREKLVTWAEESQFAIQAIQANAELAACAPHTVQNAIINVAAVGLTLNPAYGYAYLVPESVKVKQGGQEVWIKECKLRISFKGLIKVATDSGSIKWVRAEVACDGDGEEFEYSGLCEMPIHKIKTPFSRGKTIGVYCVAKTHDGDILTDIMGLADIEKIKAKAKTKNVWNEWPDEMAKKAIIKRASKQWPKTDRMEKVVELLNEQEGSEIDITPRATVARATELSHTISEEQAENLRLAIQMAGRTEEQFCKHKAIRIDSLNQLPAARYEGAMNFLKGLAVPLTESAQNEDAA